MHGACVSQCVCAYRQLPACSSALGGIRRNPKHAAWRLMVWCVCLLRAEPSPLLCSTAATPACCSCKRSCGGSSRHTPYANAFAIEWVRICKVQGAWRMADGGWRRLSFVQQDRCATMRYAHNVIVMRGAIKSPMHAVSPLSSGFVADIESRALLNIKTLIDGQYLPYGRVCSIPSSRPCQASYHANVTQASPSLVIPSATDFRSAAHREPTDGMDRGMR